jgi:lipoic acid synthetase
MPVDANGRKPKWLKVRLPSGEGYVRLKNRVRALGLHTVCEESNCPNVADCWARATCTIMILGETCTRGCAFCAVKTGRPEKPDPDEPERVATAVSRSGWKYVVLTSVTRDDLGDGGASVFAECIRRIRKASPGIRVEVLIPDFGGAWEPLRTVLEAGPDVLGHNLETVRRLTPEVRSRSDYDRSLEVLRRAKAAKAGQRTKSGIQLGHGETEEEVIRVFEDLAGVGCDILTIGQYLKPTGRPRHRDVMRYVPPEEFERLAELAEAKGIRHVFSGPLVRSSFRAEEIFPDSRVTSGLTRESERA